MNDKEKSLLIKGLEEAGYNFFEEVPDKEVGNKIKKYLKLKRDKPLSLEFAIIPKQEREKNSFERVYDIWIKV